MTERLIGVLRSSAGMPGLKYERRPEPMQGGFWAELFSFSLANPPDGWPTGSTSAGFSPLGFSSGPAQRR